MNLVTILWLAPLTRIIGATLGLALAYFFDW